jgi:hypothetical protein
LITFWDTSCLLPLVLKEEQQERSKRIWGENNEHVAWNWIRVEAESACIRQRATSQQWKDLRTIFDEMGGLDIPGHELDDLLLFNRAAQLRSADAGHLYCFRSLLVSNPQIQLASYDKEMLSAAHRMNFPIHPLCQDT